MCISPHSPTFILFSILGKNDHGCLFRYIWEYYRFKSIVHSHLYGVLVLILICIRHSYWMVCQLLCFCFICECNILICIRHSNLVLCHLVCCLFHMGVCCLDLHWTVPLDDFQFDVLFAIFVDMKYSYAL